MVQLVDKNGRHLFLGAFVRVLRLPKSCEFGEFEANRQSSIGRIAKISQISSEDTGVYWYPDGEIKLEYRLILQEGIQSMSIGALDHDLEIIDSEKEIKMLYDDKIYSYIKPFGEEQTTKYFNELVSRFGYSVV
jgi:hypothetical protein